MISLCDCEVRGWSALVRVGCPFLVPQIRSHRMRTKLRAHTAIIHSCVILVTYLTISDNHIIWQTKQTTRDTYTIIKYTKYVTKKYNWNQATITNIAWHVLHIAINRFTANKQQVLQKFIHGWLPLQTRPQVTSMSTSKLCPSCKQQPEDMAHFLSCPHPQQTILIQVLQLQLQKLHHKHKVN